jgi:uncharacterized membrane protein
LQKVKNVAASVSTAALSILPGTAGTVPVPWPCAFFTLEIDADYVNSLDEKYKLL